MQCKSSLQELEADRCISVYSVALGEGVMGGAVHLGRRCKSKQLEKRCLKYTCMGTATATLHTLKLSSPVTIYRTANSDYLVTSN